MNKKVSKEAQELYDLAKLPPPMPRPRRVKMKELDNIADVVVDILEEHLEHNIEWTISDWPLDGNDFNDAIHQIKCNVIHKLNTKYNG
mgnify:CR=1 FL=1